jgi:hypothetical protein
MRKTEKIYKVKNLISGEEFTTSTVYEKTIDGVFFIGVWKENNPQRILWIRKDSVKKTNNN